MRLMGGGADRQTERLGQTLCRIVLGLVWILCGIEGCSEES